ncbi:unnamed protein product, partial [Porites lobata]
FTPVILPLLPRHQLGQITSKIFSGYGRQGIFCYANYDLALTQSLVTFDRVCPVDEMPSPAKVVPIIIFLLLSAQSMTSAFLRDNSTQLMDDISAVITRVAKDETHRFIRPNARGPPITVQADVQIVYIGGFQEVDMTFTLELFFRQYWRDDRLSHNLPERQITLPSDAADRLWQPDTFFLNTKKGELHKLTSLNKVMVIQADGSVFISTRITLTCLCTMDFRKVPMDRQVCELKFSSYSFTTDDIVYEWKEKNKTLSGSVEIAQFTLKPVSTHQDVSSYVTGNYSVLGLRFEFTRRIGHYLTRVYIPAILIACMSWLSFFIDRKSVPARVALSIMTILTITTLLIGVGQGSLPVVSYVKAVDCYLIFCYIFVFGAFAEYAIVNSIERGHKSTEHRVVRISMDTFVYCVEIKM